jgi:hypothetical protein
MAFSRLFALLPLANPPDWDNLAKIPPGVVTLRLLTQTVGMAAAINLPWHAV